MENNVITHKKTIPIIASDTPGGTGKRTKIERKEKKKKKKKKKEGSLTTNTTSFFFCVLFLDFFICLVLKFAVGNEDS